MRTSNFNEFVNNRDKGKLIVERGEDYLNKNWYQKARGGLKYAKNLAKGGYTSSQEKEHLKALVTALANWFQVQVPAATKDDINRAGYDQEIKDPTVYALTEVARSMMSGTGKYFNYKERTAITTEMAEILFKASKSRNPPFKNIYEMLMELSNRIKKDGYKFTLDSRLYKDLEKYINTDRETIRTQQSNVITGNVDNLVNAIGNFSGFDKDARAYMNLHLNKLISELNKDPDKNPQGFDFLTKLADVFNDNPSLGSPGGNP